MKKIVAFIVAVAVCLSVCSALAVNFCPNCGEKAQQDWKVCPFCEYKFANDIVPSTGNSSGNANNSNGTQSTNPPVEKGINLKNNPYSWTKVSLMKPKSDDRVRGWLGPDDSSPIFPGMFKLSHSRNYEALFAIGNRAYVRFDYSSPGRIAGVFVLKSNFTVSSRNSIPEYDMYSSTPIKVTKSGNIYGDSTHSVNILGDRSNGDVYIKVSSGATGSAFFKENNMAFCVFNNTNCGRNIYGWISLDSIEAR